jgi:hypothetical protein
MLIRLYWLLSLSAALMRPSDSRGGALRAPESR